MINGQRPEALVHDGAAANVPDVWVALRAAVRAILEETTLHHVVSGQLPTTVAALATDHRAWTSVWPSPAG